jgi:hypothetical protein
MSVHSISPDYATGLRGWRSWPLSGTFWAGATLVTMWLAVLFVGVFGGDIQIAAVDGSHSSWPVVVIVAIAALLATVSIGRRAFSSPRADDELRSAVEDQRRAIEALTAQLERLQTPG